MQRTSAKLRKLVREAAKNRCEYCQTLQEMTLATFHVDHIIPQASGGSGEFENLCLSCPFCNEFKAGKFRATDPQTRRLVQLFNPRRDRWLRHFRWSHDGTQLMGRTARGRATVVALRMNNQIARTARRFWVASGIHPPKPGSSPKKRQSLRVS